MIFPSFTAFLALILSLLALASAFPTPQNTVRIAITEAAVPGSLLGRRYVRQLAAHPPLWATREIGDIARDGPSRRAKRFQAIQRRIARNPAAERIVPGENFLSNQSLVTPSSATSTQVPVVPAPEEPTPQAHLDASNTSDTLVSHPTPGAHARKHSKSAERKAGSKAVKKI
ncbi:hypothetical protein BDZ94DRAFT_1264933 [Collybia nuda]|uniref:Uncharacterized protein n=1 Tax=Collybia nuda TaxID=64659 RepID=A0A9P5Y076_9AGAR|nr:hypothetical protein BDZ94DRAFT_1264933 [Collybia nuda]